uniref:Cytosolic glutaredoxin n=1 Tax=Gymnochlora stellata TaxID=67809 RepID=B5A4K7_GYMST|nr:cytosolic glutaredoxin [Gymnochlora stellata]
MSAYVLDRKASEVKNGGVDEKEEQTMLQMIVDSHPVVVFSSTSCMFCDEAKDVLMDLDANFHVVELDLEKDEGKELRQELYKATSRSTTPAIFVDGEFIGGCNDGPGLIPLHKKNELVPLLRKAGAFDKVKTTKYRFMEPEG